VDGRDAVPVYRKFWARATGNPDPISGDQQLLSLAEALQEAVRYRNSPAGGHFSYSPDGAEHGTGGPYVEYVRGDGFLPPARGGKTDEALRAMGALP
jgi:hypothetical protein